MVAGSGRNMARTLRESSSKFSKSPPFSNARVVTEKGGSFAVDPNQLIEIRALIKKIANGGLPQFGEIKMRKDEIKIFYPEIKKIKKILKWKPKVKFRQGIKKTLLHYLKYNKD